MQQTLCLLKPDAVRRGLIGEILHRIERTGLKIIAARLVQADRAQALKHYTFEDIGARYGEAVHEGLLHFITSGPVLAFVVEGVEAVAVVRKLCGATEPTKAEVGTIRGDYSHHSIPFCNVNDQAIRNLIHASATVEEALHEISLWFSSEELLSYRKNDQDEHFFS